MTRVEALVLEVQSLTDEELSEFRAWFASYDAARWDRQVESDLASGQLDQIAEKALAAHQCGESREL